MLWLLALLGLWQRGSLGFECEDHGKIWNAEHRLIKERIPPPGYDKNVRPVKNPQDILNITVFFSIQQVYMYEKMSKLTVQGELFSIWNDEFINWNPADFENITMIIVDPDILWTPELRTSVGAPVPVKRRETLQPEVLYAMEDSMRSQRSMVTYQYVSLEAECAALIRHWPYDEYDCSLYVSAKWPFSSKLNLSFWYDGYMIWEYKEGKIWKLLNVSTNIKDVNSYKFLEYAFKVQRYGSTHFAIIVTPAFVFAVITILTFWMDGSSAERFIVASFNIHLHLLYLNYIGYFVPPHGEDTPLSVLYFSDSIVMVLVSILQAILIRYLHRTETAPPALILTASSWLSSTKPGQILLLRPNEIKKEEENIISESEENSEETVSATTKNGPANWEVEIILLDRLFFVIYVIIYIILLLALMT